jgi:Putative beta-lactamase-inhibitor-like, PepSY-like
MKFVRLFALIMAVQISSQSIAQVTTIPPLAKENFFRQYPDAKNIEWQNDVVNVNVRFEQDSNFLYAEYSNRGIWKWTLKDWSFEKLPQDVKDGLSKSKYAGREVNETKVLYLPGYVIQYRIKVEKSGLEKKYIFFNGEGKFLRSTVAL